MKNRFLILVAAAALLLALAAGCKKKEEGYGNTSSSTDTSYTTSTTGTTASTLSPEDKDFAMKAAQGNMSEVNGGSMAAQKGTSPDVKTFGNRMVDDHGKALDELKQLAAAKGITLPADVNADQKAMADKLGTLSGSAFDKEYAKDMVKDHTADAKDFDKASKDVKDPDLKAWAAKVLPIIQDHLKMAKDMEAKLSGAVSG